jgi:hypothetical protein
MTGRSVAKWQPIHSYPLQRRQALIATGSSEHRGRTLLHPRKIRAKLPLRADGTDACPGRATGSKSDGRNPSGLLPATRIAGVRSRPKPEARLTCTIATSHNLRWESRGRIAMYVGSRSGRRFYAAVVRCRVAAQWAVGSAPRQTFTPTTCGRPLCA